MPEDTRSRLKQWLESGEARLQPLSFPQRELWETSPVPAGDVANHICACIRVRGVMPDKDCLSALQKVVDRQEVLRLSFLPGKNQPVQLIRAKGSPMMHFREVPAAQRSPEAVEELMQEIFDAPFDLMRGPLYRVEMLRLAPDEMMMVFSIHHAIADGWSLGVFVQDLAAAYLLQKRGRGELPPVPLTCGAWDATERAFWQPAELERCTSFWRQRLSGAPRLWDRPPPSAGRLHRWVSHVPMDLTTEVRAVARKTHATLFSTLLAAFQSTLARWKGVDDIVVGTPVANRTKKAAQEARWIIRDLFPTACAPWTGKRWTPSPMPCPLLNWRAPLAKSPGWVTIRCSMCVSPSRIIRCPMSPCPVFPSNSGCAPPGRPVLTSPVKSPRMGISSKWCGFHAAAFFRRPTSRNCTNSILPPWPKAAVRRKAARRCSPPEKP
jgi:hypothetical protein